MNIFKYKNFLYKMSEDNFEKQKFTIYRFKIDPELVSLISRFSIEHQFHNRHDFKEAWNKWKEIYQDEINKEKIRIQNLNYKGDIEDKLYKAARYYYRNKFNIQKYDTEKHDTEKHDTEKKRQYIILHNDFLTKIDDHIKSNIFNTNYSPAQGYDDFCLNNIELIKQEIKELLNEYNDLALDFIRLKLKKTYKNRYYQFKKYN